MRGCQRGVCRWWNSALPTGCARTEWKTGLTPYQTAGMPRGCALIPSRARLRRRVCQPPWSPPRRNRRTTWTRRRRELDPWGPSRSGRPRTQTSSVTGADPSDDRRDARCSSRSCDARAPPSEKSCPWQAAFHGRHPASLGLNPLNASHIRWTHARREIQKGDVSCVDVFVRLDINERRIFSKRARIFLRRMEKRLHEETKESERYFFKS